MNWLLDDFAFAASVLSEAQLSGLAFGFFASLLAMSVGVEVRIKNPVSIAGRHYLFRHGILVSLYMLSMFFSSVFVSLTLPVAKEALFSVTGTLLTFLGCVGLFLCVYGLVQSAKSSSSLFRLLYSGLGILVQFAIHMAFIFLPSNQQISEVRWTGLILMYLLLFLGMVLLSRFAYETSVGETKPLKSRVVYIFGLVGLNQLVALSLIGFVQVVQVPGNLSWYGLWVGWSTFEVLISTSALVMISLLICYVYALIDRSVQVLRDDNRRLEVLKQDALQIAATTTQELEQKRRRIGELERSIELVQHDHEMSVDSLVAAVTTLEDGVFEWDIEQEVVAFSATWRRLFGLDEFAKKPIPAQLWRGGVLSEDVKNLDAALQACLSGRSASCTVQLRYSTSYGALLKLEIQLVAVKNAYGLPSKAVGIIHDRTEEMDLELSIREELNEESLLSSRKSQFVSYLSHEIRTPMTVISSAKALLELTLGKQPANLVTVQKYLDQIGAALGSLRSLVDETLMFMGSSFSRKQLSISPIDVKQVFRQFYSLEQRRRHDDHWLEYELDESLDRYAFHSDGYVFTQILRQILSFANSTDTQTGKLIIQRPDSQSVSLCLELLEWPAWMKTSGQAEPDYDQETIVPFRGESLPFSLLLTKRVIRLINGRMMIKNRAKRHWLCIDLPSMEEGTWHAS